MKKILVDAYLAKNLGDDLFIYILFNRYKNSNVKWIINTFNKEYIEIFKNFHNVEIRIKKSLDRLIQKNSLLRKQSYSREAESVDALILIGGSIFMQNNTWEIQLQRTKERLEIYKNKNKKIFILGSNFGPYKDNIFRENYEEMFKNCYDVCFRDNYSYELFKNEKNIRVASDIVFSLEKKVLKEKDTLGISVIDILERKELANYSEAYKDKLIEIINYNNKNNKKVKLFSFCEAQGDLNLCKEIFNRVENKEMVQIINYDGELESYLIQLGSVENIIGSRFHSIILSQVFKQGIYPLIYSEKSLNILKDINLDNYFMKIEEIEKIKKEEVFEIINTNKLNEISKTKRKAELQFDKLDYFMDRS